MARGEGSEGRAERFLSPNSPAVLTAETQAIPNHLITDIPPRIPRISLFRAAWAPSSAPPAPHWEMIDDYSLITEDGNDLESDRLYEMLKAAGKLIE